MTYQYKSWFDAMFAKHRADIPAYIKACHQPDMQEFIGHQFAECKRAAEAGAHDERWQALEDAAEAARAALEGDSQLSAPMAWVSLGEAIERLAWVSLGEAIERLSWPPDKVRVYELEHAELKRQMPNRMKQAFIRTISEYAQSQWRRDVDQQIRLGDMCELVWSEIASTEYRDKLPDQPQGLRPWLKPVAPEYAKKPGRPRKT